MIKYPDRIPLASLPTPFKKLENFTVPNFDGTIWIKHDELTGTEVCGTKLEKLEFSIAHALKEGCNTLITCGIQSNHWSYSCYRRKAWLKSSLNFAGAKT